MVCARGGPGVESETVTEGKGRAAVLREASLLVAVFFLGTNPVAIKLAILDVPPLPFVAIRFILAGLVLLPVALLLGRGREIGRGDLLPMAGVGFVGVAMNNAAVTLGVSMTTASNTALIYAATPIWGILLGLALGLESPRLWGIAGVALAVLGVGVVVYGGLGGRGSSLEGDLLVVAATVCWGSYAVLSLPLLRTYSPIVVASYTMLFGGLAVLPLALPGFVDAGWGEVGAEAWGAVAYSTLLVAAYGFWAWQWGVSRVGANRVLVYQYLITLVGVAAGIALLGESLTINKVLGGAVILLGVYLARQQ